MGDNPKRKKIAAKPRNRADEHKRRNRRTEDRSQHQDALKAVLLGRTRLPYDADYLRRMVLDPDALHAPLSPLRSFPGVEQRERSSPLADRTTRDAGSCRAPRRA